MNQASNINKSKFEEKLLRFIVFSALLLFYGTIGLLFCLYIPSLTGIVILIAISFCFSTIGWLNGYLSNILYQSREYEDKHSAIVNLQTEQGKLEKEKQAFEIKKNSDIKMLSELRKEKSKWYPSLAKAYDDFMKLEDLEIEKHLRYKKHPAIRSAETVRNEATRRRWAEYNSRISNSKLEYLLDLFPYLDEYIDTNEKEEDFEVDPTYLEDEMRDPVTSFMTRTEWLKLSSADRNDLALKRYWMRHKNNFEIGAIYERYIGYLFENEGYGVEYIGISQGVNDLGRDLIVSKPNSNEVYIIQCKYWAKGKNIHVAPINQLYGTTTQYRMRNTDKKVIAMFYTTTVLDDTAKEFAAYLHIVVKENFPMNNNYPCIKCNVSMRNGEKIYHLPFDQQYDRTKILEEKHETYVASCKEAEGLGFRRAYRWHGNSAH